MAYGRYVTWIIIFVAVVGVAFGLLTIADAARNDAARVADSVENETIVQEVGMWQFVNKALEADTAGFNETVTVYNSSGVELTRGVDYEWNATDGSIQYINTANVTDGATGNISYAYFRNTQSVNALSRVVSTVVSLVSWSPLLVGGLALGMMLLAAVALVSRVMGGSNTPRRNR